MARTENNTIRFFCLQLFRCQAEVHKIQEPAASCVIRGSYVDIVREEDEEATSRVLFFVFGARGTTGDDAGT